MNTAPPRVESTSVFLFPFKLVPSSSEEVSDRATMQRARDRVIQALTGHSKREGAPSPVNWESFPTGAHGDNLFNERRYFASFASRPLEDQSYLRLQHLGAAERILDRSSEAAHPWELEHQPGTLRLVIHPSSGGPPAPEARWVLQDAHLHLFPDGVGFLAIEIASMGRVPVPDLLDLHADLRRIRRRFQGDTMPTGLSVLFQPTAPGADPIDLHPESSVSLPAHLLRGWPPEGAVDVESTCREVPHPLIRWLLFPLLQGSARHDLGVHLVTQADVRMPLLAWVALEDDDEVTRDRVWERLLFVDGYTGKRSYEDEAFRREALATAEYRRWWEDHRIGFTRASTVFLGSLRDGFYTGVVRGQVTGVYYTLGLLLHVQRQSLLSMSEQSARLAQAVVNDTVDSRSLRRQVRRLREAFLLFIARYWSPEPSHEDQGLDMAQRWAAALDLPDLVRELRQEVERFDDFQAREDSHRFQAIVFWVSSLLATAALWAGLLGANLPGGVTESWGTVFGWAATSFAFSALLTVLVFLAVRAWVER